MKYKNLKRKRLDNRIQWYLASQIPTSSEKHQRYLKRKTPIFTAEIKATSRLVSLVSGLKLAPQTQPIRVKSKTNCVFVIRIFPRLAWIYSSLGLAAYIVCVVCCDWLTDLISILHRETFSKPLTNWEQTQFRKLTVTISTRAVKIFLLFLAWRD